MTPSEHRAFVAGLKAAVRIAVREEKVTLAIWLANQDCDYLKSRALGAGDAAVSIRARIQRESRKLKLKAKTKGKKR